MIFMTYYSTQRNMVIVFTVCMHNYVYITSLTQAKRWFVLRPLDLLDAGVRQGDLDPWHTPHEVFQRHTALGHDAQGAELGHVTGR